MRLLRVAVLSALLAIPTSALAQQRDFCDGFREGWVSAYRSKNRPVAPTPPCPPTTGGRQYEKGLTAGIEAALKQMAR